MFLLIAFLLFTAFTSKFSALNTYIACDLEKEKFDAYINGNAWYECDGHGNERLKYCVISGSQSTPFHGQYISRHALLSFQYAPTSGTEVAIGNFCNRLTSHYNSQIIRRQIDGAFDIYEGDLLSASVAGTTRRWIGNELVESLPPVFTPNNLSATNGYIVCGLENETFDAYINENAWYECDGHGNEWLKYCVISGSQSTPFYGQYISRNALLSFPNAPTSGTEFAIGNFCNHLTSVFTGQTIRNQIDGAFDIYEGELLSASVTGTTRRWIGGELVERLPPALTPNNLSPANTYIACDLENDKFDAYINENAWYECDGHGNERLKYCVISSNQSTPFYGQYVSRSALLSFLKTPPSGTEIAIGDFCNNLAALYTTQIIQNQIDGEYDIYEGNLLSTSFVGTTRRWIGGELVESLPPVLAPNNLPATNTYIACDLENEKFDAYINENAWYECDGHGNEWLKYCVISSSQSTPFYGQYISRNALLSFQNAPTSGTEVTVGNFCNNLTSQYTNQIIRNQIDGEFDIYEGNLLSTSVAGTTRRWIGGELVESLPPSDI